MRKITLSAALAVGLLATAGEARAACAPADLVGTWDIYLTRTDLGWSGRAWNAKIDGAGRVTGSFKYMDPTALPAFNIHSTVPLKINAACQVYDGAIQFWYGGSPSAPNENGGQFGIRATMPKSRDALKGHSFLIPFNNMHQVAIVEFVKR